MPSNGNKCMVCPDAARAKPRVFSIYCQECLGALRVLREHDAADRQRSGKRRRRRRQEPPGHEARIAALAALIEQGLPTPYYRDRRTRNA